MSKSRWVGQESCREDGFNKPAFFRPFTMFRSVLSFIRCLPALGVLSAMPAFSKEPAWARGIEGQRKADLGNGTYLNPIFSGDHADPNILKDGDDYYITFSSFDSYPGLVIWHSKDLVNWQPIGPALRKNVGSVWAPDLIRHNGRYFIYFPGWRGEGSKSANYVIWADKIEGPWSDPIDLKLGGIDPGHAVGPDGKRYIFVSLGKLAPSLADVTWADKEAWAPDCLERNGKYYYNNVPDRGWRFFALSGQICANNR